MHEGNVHAAIKLLTSNMENGILPINKDTLDLLKQKHRIDKQTHHKGYNHWSLKAYQQKVFGKELLKQREDQDHQVWMVIGGGK